jgi:hypothetical protein
MNLTTLQIIDSETRFTESTNIEVVIERAGHLEGNVEVKYRTRTQPDGTAAEHFDYIPKEGTVVFSSFETSKTITIKTHPDEPIFNNEPEEFLYIELYEESSLSEGLEVEIAGANPVRVFIVEISQTGTMTPTFTTTPTVTPTNTITSSVTNTASQTATKTQTRTQTSSTTPTLTPTTTTTNTPSVTRSPFKTPTATKTVTRTSTQTQTPTVTPTFSPIHVQRVKFEHSEYYVTEGQVLNVKVHRADAGLGALNFKYKTKQEPDATAAEDFDYIPSTGVIEFAYGEQEKSIVISTFPKQPVFNNEPNEFFYLELYAPESLDGKIEPGIEGPSVIKVFIVEQTVTPTKTSTQTPSTTQTPTHTSTQTVTPTKTASNTASQTPTLTSTPTNSSTSSHTPTPTLTASVTPTATLTKTPDPSPLVTVSSTPITGVHCEQFPFVAGETNSFVDLNIFVRENLYTMDEENLYEGKMKYHINFGDGQVVRDQNLEWSNLNKGYGSKYSHYYSEPGVYNAIVIVENHETNRRSLCGNVEVIVDQDLPDQCAQFHLRATEEAGSQEFFDAGINSFSLNVFGEVIHSNFIEPIYGISSIKFTDQDDYFEAEGSDKRFNWLHNDTQSKWTIETWINLNSTQENNPIILNAESDSDIGFKLEFINELGLIFDIFNGNVNQSYVSLNDGGFTWESGTWYHIAIVKYLDTVSLYINGQHINSSAVDNSNSSRLNSTLNLRIGRRGDEYLDGYLQDLRISQDSMYPRYEHRITDSFDVPSDLLFAECYIEPLSCSFLHIQSDMSETDEISENIILDLSINDTLIAIGNGAPEHSFDIDAIYGRSSLKFLDIDYIEAESDFRFLHNNRENWTIQSWVYIDEVQTGTITLDDSSLILANDYPVYIFHNTVNGNGVKIYYHLDGYIGVEIWDEQELKLEMKSNNLYSDVEIQEWFHFALVLKEKKYKLYINGSIADLTYVNYNSNSLSPTYYMRIGGGYEDESASFDNSFIGYIQDFIIFRTAVGESRLPPKSLFIDTCTVPFERQNPCPQLLIQSDTQDNDSNFNDLGIYNLEIIGNAVNSQERKVFDENSSIRTFGTDEYISTNFIKPETVLAFSTNGVKYEDEIDTELVGDFTDWQISKILIKINGGIHKKANSAGLSTFCWVHRYGWRYGYKSINFLSLNKRNLEGDLVEYEIWDKNQYSLSPVLSMRDMKLGFEGVEHGRRINCRKDYPVSQIGELDNIFTEDGAGFGIAGKGLWERDDFTFNIWPPLDGLDNIKLHTDFGVNESSFPDHADQWRKYSGDKCGWRKVISGSSIDPPTVFGDTYYRYHPGTSRSFL